VSARSCVCETCDIARLERADRSSSDGCLFMVASAQIVMATSAALKSLMLEDGTHTFRDIYIYIYSAQIVMATSAALKSLMLKTILKQEARSNPPGRRNTHA